MAEKRPEIYSQLDELGDPVDAAVEEDRLNDPLAEDSNSISTKYVPPSIRDFETLKPLSESKFARTYLSKQKQTSDYFAIKVLKKSDMIAKNRNLNVSAGRPIMPSGMENSHVVKLFWIFADRENLYLIMEHMGGGDCASLVNSHGRLPEDQARRFAAELVLAVTHLHSQSIIHHDLTPQNVLIDRNGHLKLADYGLSQMGLVGRQKLAREKRYPPSPGSSAFPTSFEDGHPKVTTPVGARETPHLSSTASGHSSALFNPDGGNDEFFGTPDYLAPEIVRGERTDEKCDFWSLGCIIFYFLLGCTPFRAETTDQVFRNILTGRIDWPMEAETVSASAVLVIVGLLARDSKERLSAQEVKSLRWFAKINWDTLLHGKTPYVPSSESITYAEHRDVASEESSGGKDRLSIGYEGPRLPDYETNLQDDRSSTEFLENESTESPVEGQASLPPMVASAGQTASASATCEECGKISTGKICQSNMRRHMAERHSRQHHRPSCTVCGATFSRQDYVRTHMAKGSCAGKGACATGRGMGISTLRWEKTRGG